MLSQILSLNLQVELDHLHEKINLGIFPSPRFPYTILTLEEEYYGTYGERNSLLISCFLK